MKITGPASQLPQTKTKLLPGWRGLVTKCIFYYPIETRRRQVGTTKDRLFYYLILHTRALAHKAPVYASGTEMLIILRAFQK